MALFGFGLVAGGCRDHNRLTKHDYVAEMRRLPLGRLVFPLSTQISSHNWTRPRARQHMLQRVMRRVERANRHLRWMHAMRPPPGIADLHDDLVAAGMRVNDAQLGEAELLRPNRRRRPRTYAAYIFRFEALLRKEEIASGAGDRAYYAIKRKGYDIGPSTIEDLAHR